MLLNHTKLTRKFIENLAQPLYFLKIVLLTIAVFTETIPTEMKPSERPAKSWKYKGKEKLKTLGWEEAKQSK